jgi:hypothetical protein
VARPAFAQPAVKVEEEAPPSVHPAPSVADIATVALPKLVDADKVPAGSRPDRVPAVAEDSTERTIMSGSPTVMAAEMRLSAVSKSPLDRQPITELLETYETLHQDSSLGDRDRQLVRARLMQLRRREQLAATLRGVSEFREGLKVRSVDSSEVFAQRQAPDYAAVGRLLSSIVYNGQDLPLLFRVVEPASGRTLAYVRPGTKTQATNYLGKLVGVVGAARFNAALKANIVEADRVDLLEPVDELTANHGAPFSVAAPPYAVDWGTAGVLRPEAGSL